MKVLIVADIYTHPHNRGNLQGVYRECNQMKKMGWKVDYLFWGNRLDADIVAMEEFFGIEHLFFANISCVDFKYHLYSYFRKLLDKSRITKYIALPYAVDEYYYREIEEKIEILNKKNQYDIVWLEYYLQSKIFCGLDKKILKVIHTHDKFTNRNRIFQREGKIPEFYYLTRKGEQKALSRADVVIAVQDMEQEFFADLLKGTNTISMTVGNLVEIKHSNELKKKSYGFIGAINDANEYALHYFINDILPIIKENEPDSEFIIAGAICDKIPDSNTYIKLGLVKNLDDFYNQIMFVVGPLKNGTGLNIKNIEALSYGKPVITTTIGAKGIMEAGEAVAICDEPKKFAKTVITLLNDKKRREIMGEKAIAFIELYNEKNIKNYYQIERMVLDRKLENL